MKMPIRSAAALMLFASAAFGAVGPQEAARLGQDLTPLGGEKAANADGSIPAWTGGGETPATADASIPAWTAGLKSAADAVFPNYKNGEHYSDPYASDKPLFTIT